MQQTINNLEKINRIINSKNVLEIIQLLKKSDLSVQEIKGKMNHSNISIELAKMRELDLVESKRSKNNHKIIIYKLRPKQLDKLKKTLAKVDEHITKKLQPILKEK
jgi:DNA-binding transcriptional ArsR family regulator